MIAFNNRVLFLTGAAGGIGRAIAETFYHCGARLFLVDRDGPAVATLRKSLGGDEERIGFCAANIESVEETREALLACQRQLGGIDYLVPGAGVFEIRPLADMDATDWGRMIDINLTGVFQTCRDAVPLMRDGGAIVTIASVAGHRAGVNLSHYSASKGGVLALTRGLAVELAPRLRANAVSPGLIDTSMIADLMALRGPALVANTPLKRLGRPQEVADAVAFLCSDRASYITGETLHVNGGLYIAS